MSTTYCEHLSATGITRYDGPEKVWRCDGCGWLYVNATDALGVTHMLDVEGALVTAMKQRADAVSLWTDVFGAHPESGDSGLTEKGT